MFSFNHILVSPLVLIQPCFGILIQLNFVHWCPTVRIRPSLFSYHSAMFCYRHSAMFRCPHSAIFWYHHSAMFDVLIQPYFGALINSAMIWCPHSNMFHVLIQSYFGVSISSDSVMFWYHHSAIFGVVSSFGHVFVSSFSYVLVFSFSYVLVSSFS